MTLYYTEITIRVSGLPADQVERLFDPLADAVYELADVIDADLGARIDDHEFDFTMTIEADGAPDALATGLSAVRCALHAAGGSTPGWEDHFAAIQSLVRKQEPVAV